MNDDVIERLSRASALADSVMAAAQAMKTTAAALQSQGRDVGAQMDHMTALVGQLGLVSVIKGDVSQATAAAYEAGQRLSAAVGRLEALQQRIASSIGTLRSAGE